MENLSDSITYVIHLISRIEIDISLAQFYCLSERINFFHQDV